MRSSLLLFSLLALGCPTEPAVDDTAPEGEPNGPHDTDTDADSDTDTDADGDTDADTDADTDIEWTALPGDCSVPDELPESPFDLLGELVLSGSDSMPRAYFMELVDLEVDPDTAVAWGVGQGGLVSFDVRDPSDMSMLGAFWDHGSRYYRVELGEDGVVYTTHRDQGLWALDGSDPTDIRGLSYYPTRNFAGMARDGDRLYTVGHDGWINAFDLSDPAEPVHMTSIEGLGNAWDILLAGDLAYVADNSLGIGIVDLSDRDIPSVIGSVNPGHGVQDLALDPAGTTLYAAGGGDGVLVFSLDDLEQPVLIENIPLEGSVLSVAAGGERLWAVDQLNVAAFDIAEPRAPRLLGTTETPQWSMHVAADGERAFVADWGQLSAWEADAEVEAPDLLLSTGTVVLDPNGDTVVLDLLNQGPGALALVGAGAGQGGLVLAVDGTTIEPGASGQLRLEFDGGQELDTTLCLATTDPDEPVREVELYSGEGSGGTSIGTSAPDFVLTGIDGETYQLSEQLGYPVVLVYFATW